VGADTTSAVGRSKSEQSNSGAIRLAAYTEIRDRILRSEYRPGAALSEAQIAGSLLVSRTPVREALKQLEQEGLVRSVPQRGVFVTELTVSDIDEIFQIREQLESLAARIAAVRMSDDEIASLGDELRAAEAVADAGRLEDAFRADVSLHKQIIAVTRNRRLGQILSTLDNQVHRIRYLSPTTPGRLRATLAEHLEIVEALKARDPDVAGRVMIQHLRNARDNAISLTRPTANLDR
jgi:GntR family transcriptional regulator, rspAB operon transcriptional repressor